MVLAVAPAVTMDEASSLSLHLVVGLRANPWFRLNRSLHVEYAGGRIEYGILFISSLFHENSNLVFVHIHGIYRVNEVEFVVRILAASPQEYVKTCLTCSVVRQKGVFPTGPYQP